MVRLMILLVSLAISPLHAAELGDSYIKLFQLQQQQADSGDAGAQYSLGEMHEQGLGTKVDMKKAYQWYAQAAAKGDIRAKHKMANRPRRNR